MAPIVAVTEMNSKKSEKFKFTTPILRRLCPTGRGTETYRQKIRWVDIVCRVVDRQVHADNDVEPSCSAHVRRRRPSCGPGRERRTGQRRRRTGSSTPVRRPSASPSHCRYICAADRPPPSPSATPARFLARDATAKRGLATWYFVKYIDSVTVILK